MKRRELLKSEVAPAYKSLCHESQPIITMLFGDGLPQSIRNISQVKRMAAKSMGRDRRKVSSSSTLILKVLVLIRVHGSRRFGHHGRCNLNFKRHYEYRKPHIRETRHRHVILQRAPVHRQNYNELASSKGLSSGRWPFGAILLFLE